jgi:AsmA protein
MKRWMKIVLAAVALLFVAVGVIPFLIHADSFRPLLERQMTAALGKPVRLGNLSLSIRSGSLVASGLSIADDPQYSTAPFLTARQLRIAVAMRPLIFSRQLQVLSLAVVAPEIHLVRGTDGTWNFSNIGRDRLRGIEKVPGVSAITGLVANLITVEDGRAVLERASPAEPLVYQHLTLSLRQFSFAKPFAFTIGASLPKDGAVTVSGNAGPINQIDAAMTPVDSQVSVQHLDPVAADLLDPSVGVSMLANIDAHAASDGHTVTSSGKIHMEHLQLRKGARPAPNPIDLHFNVTHSLQDNTGKVQDATVNMGKVAIHLSGDYRLRAENPSVNFALEGQRLPIDELQAFLTASGVKMPNGAVLRGGTLNVTLAIKGPANALLISGPAEMNDSQLVGFDLGSKIHGIAALSGLKTGDTTNIEKLQLKFRTTNAGTQLDDIYAIIPAMGELEGSGTISPATDLDLQLTVKVNSAAGIGKVGVGLLTKLNKLAHPAGKEPAAKGVPMTVRGTESDPIITADVRGLLHRDKAALLSHFEGKK